VNVAERGHEALRSMFENICTAFDDGRFERRGSYDLVRFQRIPLPMFNGVWPLDDAAAPSLSDALGELSGAPSSVQVRMDRTPAVVEEARRLGFLTEEPLPGMAVRRDDLAAPSVEGLEVTRLTGDDVAEAMPVAVAGFDVPESIMIPLYAPEVATLDGIEYYLGRVDGEPVSTSLGYTVGDVVGVFNVATPVAHRGRGYGAALTAAAARGGFERGAEIAFLQSSGLGFSVYRRLGFEEVESYVLMMQP
jgi:N-acetylglutamate synthase